MHMYFIHKKGLWILGGCKCNLQFIHCWNLLFDMDYILNKCACVHTNKCIHHLMPISHFYVFLLMALFTVYFISIVILNYENDGKQKANLSNFLEFKMCHKSLETTLNTNKHTIQEVLRRRQQPWRWGVQWLAIRSRQWPIESNHQSWSSYNYVRSCSYNYVRSCWRTQRQPFYGHLAFEANWKGEKAP